MNVTANTDGKFDITAQVKGDFLYGGYYKDYGKKGANFDATALTYTNGEATDDGGTSYVGGLGPWKKANIGDAGKGTEMKPQAGQVYYLKEVPAAFLKSAVYVVYDGYNKNTVVGNYLLADVDDNNYQDIGLYTELTTGARVKLAASYTIVDTLNGGREDKITAQNFGATKGYVAVWNPDLAGKDFTLVPYFVTPDGVTVEGAKIRTISWGDGTYVEGFKAPGVSFTDPDNTNIKKPGQIQIKAR